MASVISALTSGGGGISMTGDASGILNLNSNGTNVVAVTSAGASVTGTLAATGASTFTGTGKFATTIGVGNATPSASGSGITFPATQSASSDANTLDDYEEGTWTPSDGSGASLTFSVAQGFYTKVGRLVTASFTVTYPATANASIAQIGGLPFTVANLYDGANSGTIIRYTSYASAFTLPPNNSSTAMAAYSYGGAIIANSAFTSKRIDAVAVYYVA